MRARCEVKLGASEPHEVEGLPAAQQVAWAMRDATRQEGLLARWRLAEGQPEAWAFIEEHVIVLEPGAWVETPRYTGCGRQVDLGQQALLPGPALAHGICPECRDFWGKLFGC